MARDAKINQYAVLNKDAIFAELKSSEEGLSSQEAGSRYQKYGSNEIRMKEKGLLFIFIRQFKSPFFYLLFIASALAFLINEKIDSILIAFFVVINVLLRFLQEARTERAIALLRRYISSKVRVIRGNKEIIIDKKFLVPGDIVGLEAGNIVPADARVLKADNFLVDESILTGESVPAAKTGETLQGIAENIFEAKNLIFAGTVVVTGESRAVILRTGRDTLMGEIAKLASKQTKESIYEKELIRFSRLILRIVVLTIVFVFLAKLALHGTANFFEFLIFAIALIVGIIPEALPIVATFALSAGALRMVKNNVVVKRLSAVEDLGNIEILCADKTGTLTENNLKLVKTFSDSQEKCLFYGLLSSPLMEKGSKDTVNPFDSAIYQASSEKIRGDLEQYNIVSEIPFDPFRLRNSVVAEDKSGQRILIIKGAPEVVLENCSVIDGDISWNAVRENIVREGQEGKRILAVAYKNLEKEDFDSVEERGLIFLGYFVFRDPLKSTSKETIELAGKLGVRIKIITGDSKEVAGAVAKEIGLVSDPRQVLLGEELERMSPQEFSAAVEEQVVFARVNPFTKYKIIEVLQLRHEVGFLGEGINDALVLKLANVAVTVDKAADVLREVSDIVLLKSDLKVIIEGIRSGRHIFANINKYIKCTLASNFGNFYSLAVISLFIKFLPMLPTQVLIVNLLSDFPLISVATDKVDLAELRKPKQYQLKQTLLLIVLLGLISSFFDFVFFGIFRRLEPPFIQTLWFIESTLTEIALIYAVRSRYSIFKAQKPSTALVVLSILTLLAVIFLPFLPFGQRIFHFVAPTTGMLLTVFGLILSYFIASELVKLAYFRRKYPSPGLSQR